MKRPLIFKCSHLTSLSSRNPLSIGSYQSFWDMSKNSDLTLDYTPLPSANHGKSAGSEKKLWLMCSLSHYSNIEQII